MHVDDIKPGMLASLVALPRVPRGASGTKRVVFPATIEDVTWENRVEVAREVPTTEEERREQRVLAARLGGPLGFSSTTKLVHSFERCITKLVALDEANGLRVVFRIAGPPPLDGLLRGDEPPHVLEWIVGRYVETKHAVFARIERDNVILAAGARLDSADEFWR